MDLMDNIELLRLNDNKNEIICDPGSIVQIDVLKNPYQSSAEYVDITVQDSKASKFYKFEAGVTINSLPYDYETKTWNFKAPLALFRDESGVPKMQAITDNYSKWIIEHLDLDLETKENYFSLDPEKLVQVGDKYYTTLRTSWNILFNPEQMTPYVVTSFDETEGTFEMAPITGNIIPAGTPVIIETKSKIIEENRMVPTKTAAANGAVPAVNLLKSSEKYFPNQTVAMSANYKQLMVNANGELAFGGDALSTVNGNEAYLQVSSEVALKPDYKEVTLAQLVATGKVGQKYIVTDLTAVIPFDEDRQFLCKDNNGYAEKDDYSNRPAGVAADKWIDYMHQQTDLNAVPTTYDQSNWIALRLPNDGKFDINMGGATLSNVKGRLLNKVNPELLLDEFPTQGDDATEFTMNVYVPASFYGQNHQTGSNGVEYFFVQPKPMELAAVEWGFWDGTKFVMPPSVGSWNQAGLSGEFDFNAAYLTGFNAAELQADHGYTMSEAIVRYKTGSYDHIYVLGNVNGLNSGDWDPNKGVEMYTADGQTYTTMVRVDNAGLGYGYFSFSKKLGAKWEDISGSRFGAVSDGDFDVEDGPWYDQELSLEASGDSYKIPAGNYWLTITGNNADMKLVITRVNSNAASAPRRAGEATKQQYVVYPLSLKSNGSSKDGDVITGVAGVTGSHEVAGVDYINLAGQRSSRPWQGVNIVVTRYSDGTTQASKVLR